MSSNWKRRWPRDCSRLKGHKFSISLGTSDQNFTPKWVLSQSHRSSTIQRFIIKLVDDESRFNELTNTHVIRRSHTRNYQKRPLCVQLFDIKSLWVYYQYTAETTSVCEMTALGHAKLDGVLHLQWWSYVLSTFPLISSAFRLTPRSSGCSAANFVACWSVKIEWSWLRGRSCCCGFRSICRDVSAVQGVHSSQ